MGKRVAMDTELDKATVAKAYACWAPVYDIVFGAVFEQGRRAAIVAAERIGGRILEVGVGTGISLAGLFPSQSPRRRRSLRADAAQGARAGVRAAPAQCRGPRGHGRQAAGVPDGSFDVVVAQYVITTVPDPEATLDEFARVLRPGGEIVLVSRIGAEAGLRRAFEQWFAPVTRPLGWRLEFPWARYARWAERSHDVRVVERRPMRRSDISRSFDSPRLERPPCSRIDTRARGRLKLIDRRKRAVGEFFQGERVIFCHKSRRFVISRV